MSLRDNKIALPLFLLYLLTDAVAIIQISLHFQQLRGRVGRGAEQSYCLLMTSFKLSHEAKKRIGTLVRTNDGFEIAEVDLKMRGPGDIMGTQQSGLLDLKIADLARDGQIVQLARDAAVEVLEDDPDLMHKKNYEMRTQLFRQIKNRPDWSRIS